MKYMQIISNYSLYLIGYSQMRGVQNYVSSIMTGYIIMHALLICCWGLEAGKKIKHFLFRFIPLNESCNARHSYALAAIQQHFTSADAVWAQ